MKMYTKLLLVCVVGIFLSVSSVFAQEKKTVSAPDFELQDTHQDMVKFSDYKGEKPMILFFWTTWCPYCQKQLTVLRDMYAGIKKDGFDALAIDVGESADTVINFTKTRFLPYRVLMDKDTSVSRSYEVVGVPTYILVDKKGDIVFQDNFFPQAEYKEIVEKENG